MNDEFFSFDFQWLMEKLKISVVIVNNFFYIKKKRLILIHQKMATVVEMTIEKIDEVKSRLGRFVSLFFFYWSNRPLLFYIFLFIHILFNCFPLKIFGYANETSWSYSSSACSKNDGRRACSCWAGKCKYKGNFSWRWKSMEMP